jgi:predicted metalloprotease with PDZ domain
MVHLSVMAYGQVGPGDFAETYRFTQQDYWRVSYVVRPAMENGAVDITAVLMGDVANGVVWRHADPLLRTAIQARPEAEDGFGQQLRVASHPQGWTISGGSGGGMRVSYRVTAPGPEPIGVEGVGIGAESIYAPGYELFLAPDPSLTVGSGTGSTPGRGASMRMEIVFDIPISWRIVVPWEGYGRKFRPTDTNDLWSSLVAVGDFRRHSVRAAGVDLVIGIQGREPSRDASVIEAMRRIVTSGQQIFGTLPATSLTIVLPRAAPDGSPAVQLGHSLAMDWSVRGGQAWEVGDLHRVARQLLHLWQAQGPGGPAWYCEGATDYVAWLVLLRQNLVQRDVFRQQILIAERNYLAHPMAEEWSFAQEEARSAVHGMTPIVSEESEIPDEPGTFPDVSSPGSLARTRGVIVALTLDATIARLTGGERRLTDLMRTVYRWNQRGETRVPGGVATLMAASAAITGGDYLDTLFQQLVFGSSAPPTAEALADILDRERAGGRF